MGSKATPPYVSMMLMSIARGVFISNCFPSRFEFHYEIKLSQVDKHIALIIAALPPRP
jgi:hypothetical protein